MASPEIVDYVRNFAVMVRVQGPDPKGLKMREHAFHHYYSGRTTLSASGLLVPDNIYDSEVANHFCGLNDPCTALVLTVSSIFEPFRTPHQRGTIHEERPELSSGAMIDIMVEGRLGRWGECTSMLAFCATFSTSRNLDYFFHACLDLHMDIPASSAALQSLSDTSLGSPFQEWGVGWSLVSNANDPQSCRDAIQKQRNLTPEESGRLNLTARMAIVGVSLSHQDTANIYHPQVRGEIFVLLLVLPLESCHLCISLTGMDGSPVFDEHARLIAIHEL